jgi:hypothetical protein
MKRIITCLVAAAVAAALMAGFGPSATASDSPSGIALSRDGQSDSSTARRAAQCFADPYRPSGQRYVGLCGKRVSSKTFNFYGKVKPYGSYKWTKLERKNRGPNGGCNNKYRWSTRRWDKTSGSAVYNYPGVSRTGCYRVIATKRGSFGWSASTTVRIYVTG